MLWCKRGEAAEKRREGGGGGGGGLLFESSPFVGKRKHGVLSIQVDLQITSRVCRLVVLYYITLLRVQTLRFLLHKDSLADLHIQRQENSTL